MGNNNRLNLICLAKALQLLDAQSLGTLKKEIVESFEVSTEELDEFLKAVPSLLEDEEARW